MLGNEVLSGTADRERDGAERGRMTASGVRVGDAMRTAGDEEGARVEMLMEPTLARQRAQTITRGCVTAAWCLVLLVLPQQQRCRPLAPSCREGRCFVVVLIDLFCYVRGHSIAWGVVVLAIVPLLGNPV